MMKFTIKQITGLWFALGAVMGVSAFFYKIYAPDASLISIFLAIFTAFFSGYYFGQQWGMLIINLNTGLKNALKSIVYGLIVGVCTLYFILIILAISSYFQTKFLYTFKTGHYWQIGIEFILIPLASLFALILGCFLEPLVWGLSSAGGIVLYLLRHQLLRLVSKE